MPESSTTSPDPTPYLVNEAEAARLLGVCPITVRRWGLDGRLARVSLGRLQRYRYSDIRRVLDEGLPALSKPRA